jgi:hypothetical protein
MKRKNKTARFGFNQCAQVYFGSRGGICQGNYFNRRKQDFLRGERFVDHVTKVTHTQRKHDNYDAQHDLYKRRN